MDEGFGEGKQNFVMKPNIVSEASSPPTSCTGCTLPEERSLGLLPGLLLLSSFS